VDTQWPRFEVFEQDGPDQPYRHTGGVRAPDAEKALQEERPVFTRRPECTGFWLAPQTQVYGWTSATLRSDPSWQTDTVALARLATPYEVFAKPATDGPNASPTHIGSVDARSPTEALRLALAKFDAGQVELWWLVPARAIVRATR